MASSYDVQIVSCELYWIPVKTRVPLKFGSETLTSVTCARTCVTVRNSEGKEATGWGGNAFKYSMDLASIRSV